MKRIWGIVLVVILAVVLVSFTANGKQLFEKIFFYSPCDRPIRYAIGTIDSRFHVTPDDLLTDTKAAANIWNMVENKQLFAYDPASTFTINMVYDSRQALTSKITQLNTDLKEQQGAIDPRIEAFKKKQVDFEQRVSQLNKQVQYWNSKGGAPKEEYDKLVAQQKELQSEAQSLNTEAESLGQSTQEYNLNAQKLNQTIDNYKQVLQYKPEEGLYEQEGGKRKISIYIDISKDEFLHTVTHEMGHALGLDHNNNALSIMYPQTTNVLTPSTDDINSLNALCMRRPITEVVLNRMQEVFQIISERMKSR